jgi:hypothetical protein
MASKLLLLPCKLQQCCLESPSPSPAPRKKEASGATKAIDDFTEVPEDLFNEFLAAGRQARHRMQHYYDATDPVDEGEKIKHYSLIGSTETPAEMEGSPGESSFMQDTYATVDSTATVSTMGSFSILPSISLRRESKKKKNRRKRQVVDAPEGSDTNSGHHSQKDARSASVGNNIQKNDAASRNLCATVDQSEKDLRHHLLALRNRPKIANSPISQTSQSSSLPSSLPTAVGETGHAEESWGTTQTWCTLYSTFSKERSESKSSAVHSPVRRSARSVSSGSHSLASTSTATHHSQSARSARQRVYTAVGLVAKAFGSMNPKR